MVPAGPAIADVSLADVGLEAASLDRSAAPCDDFYQYACGGWLAANEIPADKARHWRFAEIEDRNAQAVRAILDDLVARPAGGGEVEQKLGEFYGSCLDESAIETRGLAGLAPLLGPIDKIKDVRSLQAALIALHRHGIPALWTIPVLFDLGDLSRSIIYVDTGGLGLPDRDYYVADRFAPARAAYEAHLVRLFELRGLTAGKGKASRLAADVMALETTLAGLAMTRAERHHPSNLYNPTSVGALAIAAPAIDWAAYFTALGTPDPGPLSVTTPRFLDELSAVIRETRPAVWRAYLTARVLDASAIALPRAFDDETFALARATTGVEARPPRWQRCVDATAAAMPDYLGKVYVDHHFAGDAKTIVTTLVAAIVDVMREQTSALPWMTGRGDARATLDTKLALIGYPDTWRTYTFSTNRADFAANRLAAGAFEVRRQLARAGKGYDRREWLMPAFVASAYHSSAANVFAIPAGLLQVPFFGAERSIAVNLGGIGMAVGHELTHGFGDEAAGGGRGRCLARQYSTFEVLPGTFVDGALTLNENIADLGGVKHAFLAYRKLRAGAATVDVAGGLTEDQQFFVAVGQAWCGKDRPEKALELVTSDVHAPPRWRINGTLRNLPEFAVAFGCTPGQPMSPVERCTIW
jgi:putative endopeptidase